MQRDEKDQCIEKYGQVATVMKTDRVFVVPQVTVEDYTPDGEHGLSESGLSSLKTDAMKARLKLVRELKLQYPQCIIDPTFVSRVKGPSGATC